MFPAALPAAYGVMPPPMLTGLSQGAPSETTLGTIPARSVYSAIALPPAQNQREGQTPSRSMPDPELSLPVPAVAFILVALANPGSAPDRSVAFFAQLLAQSSPEMQAQITRNFPEPVPMRPVEFPIFSTPAAARTPDPAPVPEASPLLQKLEFAVIQRGATYAPILIPQPKQAPAEHPSPRRATDEKQALAAYEKAKARAAGIKSANPA